MSLPQRTIHANSGVVLIVDDDEDIRDILAELLQSDGYKVAHATNGHEAIEWLKANSRPAVILLDIMMPMMNGWEFLRYREKHTIFSAIPVVVMSANLELIRKSEITGFDRLAKPFDTSRLLKIVSKWVRGTDPPSAPSVSPPGNERPSGSADRVHVLGEDRGVDSSPDAGEADGEVRRGVQTPHRH